MIASCLSHRVYFHSLNSYLANYFTLRIGTLRSNKFAYLTSYCEIVQYIGLATE